jgi:hypothetical protein
VSIFDTKYRIRTTDARYRYVAEYKVWWWPFWLVCNASFNYLGGMEVTSNGRDGWNFCRTVFEAKAVIEAHRQARTRKDEVVWTE